MAKFGSPVIDRKTLQAECGQDTPGEDTITRIYQRFCETGTVEGGQRSGRPSTITEEESMKFIMLPREKPTQVFELLQLFA